MGERLHQRGRAGRSQHESRYDVLLPRFKQPARPIAPRDRYRAAHHDEIYDTVEDAGADDLDSQLDSFDTRLLQQQYPTRQHQAAQNRGRLSLAPAPSVFCSNEAPAHCRPSYVTPSSHSYENRGEHRPHLEQNMDSQLARLAYHPAQYQEPTSDPPIDPYSSPAFKASQRRIEQAAMGTSKPDSRAGVSKNGLQYAIQLKGYGDRQLHRQMVSLESQEQVPCQLPTITQQTNEMSPRHGLQTLTESRTTLMGEPNAPPMCQGIRLVPVATLPDRLRTVFPYPTFNAVQSKCFDKVFRSNNNFVLASPTGSGKTVILELAICRALATNSTDQYKIVYQAPTKALCSERQRDWGVKFNNIGLRCVELTGDSDVSDLRHVQSANIIITTPEKWDSTTRKWKDHEKLMKLIKVFLIDEVHILKEDRGATLETVVSRMKSVGTNVRFVALSATVPNVTDIAAWLGCNSSNPDVPAPNESFGEEFRPVKLQKYVCGYASHNNNEFGFERVLDTKVTDVIASYSEGKPIIVFCATRNSTLSTAKLIASWWASRPDNDRFWPAPSRPITLLNKDLRDTVASGVAFHHAGLDTEDRMQIEKNFIAGEISVICCTSTLAVGVNLPCHLVIIKNTVGWGPEGHQEYSELEMTQMLGRAGRPQFDNTAVAVIMTRQAKVRQYELMVTNQEIIESKLHLNLIDHMNAEIGLGTIRDLPSARKWLKGTFLFVRLQQNPDHYRLEGDKGRQSIEEQVDDICFRDVNLLQESNLVSGQEFFQCTEFGHAMSRYYVRFETMKLFMGLQTKSSPSEILSVIAQAKEYANIRFRQGEKSLYKALNKSPSIRWPIPVNLDLPAQKISLIIQSVLGSADISWDGETGKHKSQYTTETIIIFKNIRSLIRCIIDCQIVLGDAVSTHSALMLERSFGARAWDDSPLQMKQVETLGVVAVRKLVNAGIKSLEDLEGCDPQRIEALIGRNPPYGLQILEKIKCFPKLRVSLQDQRSTIAKCLEGVKIQIKADVGFMNKRPPHFNNKPIYICLLLETSDGRMAHFARISGSKLGAGQTVTAPVFLTGPDQFINCHVMCDGIAGSMRSATLRPRIPLWMYPSPRSSTLGISAPNQSNMSKRRTEDVDKIRNPTTASDDFGDDGLDDDALVEAACRELEFNHIDSYDDPLVAVTQASSKKAKSNKESGNAKSHCLTKPPGTVFEASTQGAVQLPNGKWACNHPCKDRRACKHLCCKTGMEKPPKKKHVAKSVQPSEPRLQQQQKLPFSNTKEVEKMLQLKTCKRKSSAMIEELDLTQQEKRKKADQVTNDSTERNELLQRIKGKDLSPGFDSLAHARPSYRYYEHRTNRSASIDLSFVDQHLDSRDSGSMQLHEGLDSPQLCNTPLSLQSFQPHHDDFIDCKPITTVLCPRSDMFSDEDSLFGDAMIGLADSHGLQANNEDQVNTMEDTKDFSECENRGFLEEGQERMNTELANSKSDTDDIFATVSSAEQRYQSREASAGAPCAQSNSSIGGLKFEGACLKAVTNLLDDEMKGSTAPQTGVILAELNKGRVVKDSALTLANMLDTSASITLSKKESVPDDFKDLEPWLLQEFGNIVELVDE